MLSAPEPYTILVTGSVDFTDRRIVGEALLEARDNPPALALVPTRIQVRHGTAPGADWLADELARGWGWLVDQRPADWTGPCGGPPLCWPGHRRLGRHQVSYCPAAGFRRNQAMVDLGAAVCLAFYWPGARNAGTADCARRADAAGIEVRPYGAAAPPTLW